LSLRGWRILLVCWMALIFFVSSSLLANRASFDATELLFGSLNYFARKTAHVVEYGILTFLWFRSLWIVRSGFRRAIGQSVLLTILYAVTDEVHQSMVPERLGLWSDVVFDAAGALAAGVLLVRTKEQLERAIGGVLGKRLLGPLADPT